MNEKKNPVLLTKEELHKYFENMNDGIGRKCEMGGVAVNHQSDEEMYGDPKEPQIEMCSFTPFATYSPEEDFRYNAISHWNFIEPLIKKHYSEDQLKEVRYLYIEAIIHGYRHCVKDEE